MGLQGKPETKLLFNVSKPLRVGVIGVGNLGQYHVEKYLLIPEAHLVGIFDASLRRGQEISLRFGIPAFSDIHSLLRQCDAVSVVVPTSKHYEVASLCLKEGLHVLVEKPMCASSSQALGLMELAAARNKILQVGHIERFNPAILKVTGVSEISLIEAYRWSPWPGRNLDVDVILDLMVHDIDLVSYFLGAAQLLAISGIGCAAVGEDLDVVQTCLQFEGGRAAILSSSRVSAFPKRLLRLYQEDRIFHIDLLKQEVLSYPAQNPKEGELLFAAQGHQNGKTSDALFEQLRSFVLCAQSGRKPLVSADQGLRAIIIAEQIRNALILLQDETTKEDLSHSRRSLS